MTPKQRLAAELSCHCKPVLKRLCPRCQGEGCTGCDEGLIDAEPEVTEGVIIVHRMEETSDG